MKLNLKSNIDFRYSGIVSIVVMVFGFLISFVLVPFVTNKMVKKMTVLTPGSFLRRHQDNTTYTVKFYLFNVTNPAEVVVGGRPMMVESGPFVYDMHKMRVNHVDDEEADTLTYDLKHMYYYRPDLSVAGAENMTLCSISALLMGGLTKTIIETPELMSFVKTGIDKIHGLDTPIVSYHPLDILHKGYYLNCDQSEFSAKAICSALGAQDYFKRINGSDKHLLLAAMFKINNSIETTYTILRGKKNLKDVGRIVAIKGDSLMNVYEYEKCNIINGTDGISFPPKQTKDTAQWFYYNDLCTAFPLEYTSKKRIHGINTYLKELIWDSPLFDPDCNFNEYLEHGYRGSIDLHDCQEAFTYVAAPHNYLAHSLLSQNIDGMTPEKKKHFSGFYFDPITGIPLRSYFRYQIDILTKPIADYPIMSKLLEFNLPTTWQEFIYEAPSHVIKRLQTIHTGKSIVNFIGRFAFLMGVIGCMLSIAAISLGIGPDTPKILNVVPNSGNTGASTPGSASTRAD